MSDGLSWAAIGTIGAIGVAGIGGLFVLLLSIRGKLSSVEVKVNWLTDAAKENARDNKAEHSRIWEKIDDHGERITRLEVER